MWQISEGRFAKPNIPLYNWEELGRMDSAILRTLRYITFGRYTPSYDGAYFLDKKMKPTDIGEMYLHELDELYPMHMIENRLYEEWPSEKWNFQDNYGRTVRKVHAQSNPRLDGDESEESVITLTHEKMQDMLTSVGGIGKKRSEKILNKFDLASLVHTLEEAPHKLADEFSWIKKKLLKEITKQWESLKNKL